TPVTYFGKYKGALAVGNPFLVILSPIPASGTMSLPFGFGDALQPGTGSTIFLQGAVFKQGGGGLLADARTMSPFGEGGAGPKPCRDAGQQTALVSYRDVSTV